MFKISLAHEGHHCFFLQEVVLDKRPFSCVAIERIVLFDLSCLNDIYILNDKVVLVYWRANVMSYQMHNSSDMVPADIMSIAF